MVATSKRTNFRVGQTWCRRDGTRYRLTARTEDGWDVTIGDSLPWRFTDRHLHNLVCSERLMLEQDHYAALASRMRNAGLIRLSEHLLALGRSPKSEKSERLRKAQDAEQHLEEQLRDTDDPESRDRIEDELRDVRETLDTEGPVVTPPNHITAPEHVTDDIIPDPNPVTRN